MNSLRIIYTILFYFIQPLVWIRLLLRSHRTPDSKCRWTERYGFCKKKVIPEGILLHSVSVGETLSAISLLHVLRYRYPLLPITVTTTTYTASERVMSVFNHKIHHVYLPYDLPCAMNRFLNTVRPKLVIIMETELWPNMIYLLHKRKIPLIIANARMSERSAKRYNKLGKFMYCLLNKVTLIAAQNEEDAERFISLGLKRKKLVVTGNLKFDFSITSEFMDKIIMLRRQWAGFRKVWIASSTHDGEEAIILRAHRKLIKNFPNLLLILVPRHPERFNNVRKMVQKASFKFILRSTGETPSDNTQVVIGDTMGELILLYGISDLAFIGGSLIEKGGHNPLEAAIHGIPILMGPYIFNFKDICNKLHQSGGLITVINEDSLVEKITNLLINKDCSLWYGGRAINVLYQNQGALSRLLETLQPYLPFWSN